MRVHVWRTTLQHAKEEAVSAAADAIGLRLAMKMKAQGLNKMRDILARTMRGVVWMRLSIWMTQVKAAQESIRAHAAAMMATKLAQRSKGQAVTKLRQVFARMMRGELGMRTSVWMFRFKQSQKAKLAEAAEALARKVAQRCKGKAVRKLGLIWSRMMRGETGMCIHMWTQAAYSDRTQVKALRMLRATLGRVVRGVWGEVWQGRMPAIVVNVTSHWTVNPIHRARSFQSLVSCETRMDAVQTNEASGCG